MSTQWTELYEKGNESEMSSLSFQASFPPGESPNYFSAKEKKIFASNLCLKAFCFFLVNSETNCGKKQFNGHKNFTLQLSVPVHLIHTSQ